MDDTLGAPPQNLLGLTLAFPIEAVVSSQKRELVRETYWRYRGRISHFGFVLAKFGCA
jgi:hypothetical protein